MLGKAAIAMWWDIPPDVRAEWEEWHTREHMPERLSIPGFLRGTRWIAESGQPSYFVLYEAERLETITGGAYLERLNNPAPWSRQMMPHHRNMVRSLCALRKLSQGKGLTGARLLESQPMPGTQTTEQKIRGRDATADWILLVGGYEVEAVMKNPMPEGMVGLYRPAYSLSAGEIA